MRKMGRNGFAFPALQERRTIMTTDRNKEIMAANIKKYMERKGVTNQQFCDDLDLT